MRYHSACPNPSCGAPLVREWVDYTKIIECPVCRVAGPAPDPRVQHDAWVDEPGPPDELSDAAYEVHGLEDGGCTVPGCTRRADVLDHREAFANGGRTCVSNLYPMCSEHNASKGDTDYGEWLRTNP